MFWKKQPTDIEQVKNNVANFAFEKFLTPDTDYTVMADINGVKLVKKIVRWAYFDLVKGGIQSVFSIETDKGIFCFQVQGEKFTQIKTDICTQIYPQLLPH